MFSKSLTRIVLGLLLLAAAPVAAQPTCPTGFYLLNLKGLPVNPTNTLNNNVSFHTGFGVVSGTPSQVPAAGCSAWRMAALKIVIPNGCTQANIVVEYEGLPKGFTVNLGDSPTNDGFAGDAGSTEHEAEVWIRDGETLELAPANMLVPLGIDSPLIRQHLALTNAALKFVVKEQSVSWGNPYSIVQTPATKNLFALSDPLDPRTIYLGLNRVITGRPDRTGCGARRVLVSFQ